MQAVNDLWSWLAVLDPTFAFLVALPLMFGLGLYLGGRLFPFAWSEPLVALAVLAVGSSRSRQCSSG